MYLKIKCMFYKRNKNVIKIFVIVYTTVHTLNILRTDTKT